VSARPHGKAMASKQFCNCRAEEVSEVDGIFMFTLMADALRCKHLDATFDVYALSTYRNASAFKL
jgi:hypothetical protein